MKNIHLQPMTLREFSDKSFDNACALMGQIAVIKKLNKDLRSHESIAADILSMDAGDAFREVEIARQGGVFDAKYDFAINKVREALQKYGAI